MAEVTYDTWYRADAQACGEPFEQFARFCEAEVVAGTTVLDLGCGQGRDAVLFAQHGAEVVGVDVSAVGVQQLNERAAAEGLRVSAVVGDVVAFEPAGTYDVVLLDRVLHMLPSPADRARVLDMAMAAMHDGGALLIADEPKRRDEIRARLLGAGLVLFVDSKNRWFARKV